MSFQINLCQLDKQQETIYNTYFHFYFLLQTKDNIVFHQIRSGHLVDMVDKIQVVSEGIFHT